MLQELGCNHSGVIIAFDCGERVHKRNRSGKRVFGGNG